MGLMIIGVSTACIVGLVLFVKCEGWKNTGAWDIIGGSAFLLGFSALLMVLVTMISSMVIGEFSDRAIVIVDETPLVALKDGSSISGSFFLGCGTIGESQKYSYLKEITSPSGRKAFKAGSIHVASAVVIEDDYKSPRMIRYKYVVSNSFFRWLLFEGPAVCGSSGRVPTEFVIPVGSVINTYEVDLE